MPGSTSTNTKRKGEKKYKQLDWLKIKVYTVTNGPVIKTTNTRKKR
jgi:hypothetical protein